MARHGIPSKDPGPHADWIWEFLRSYSGGGEWFISELGVHESYDHWQAGGSRNFLEELKDRVDQILTHHEPLALDENVDRELNKICERARAG